MCRTFKTKDRTNPAYDLVEQKPHWKDREYREAYMETAIEQGIAWQIKLNRELRGMTQCQLAHAIGTKQSAISRMEDPTYGSHSLKTLILIAKEFDCAVSVRLISYSDLAAESQRLSEFHQYALPFELESEDVSGQALQLSEN